MFRSLLALALIAVPAAADSVHGLSSTQYDAWLKTLAAKQAMPRLVHVHSLAGKGVFAAVTAPNPDKLVWSSKHGLTAAAFNTRFKELSESHRLECLCVYNVGAGPRFADLWVKAKKVPFSSRYGLASEEYQKLFEGQKKLGHRPVCVNGYIEKGLVRYAAVFHEIAGSEWEARHGVSEKEYEKLLLDYKVKGFRPSQLSAFHDGKSIRVNFVVEKVTGSWTIQHGITGGAFQKEDQTHAKEGLLTGAVAGYPSGTGSRYTAFWIQPGGMAVKPPIKTTKLPVSGTEVPALAAFDTAMLTYMKEREIETGSLCVMRGGKIVLSRGYGFLTKDQKKPLPPDAPFRIASITKPITAAIVRDLARQGKFKLGDKAFDYIGIAPPVGKKADPRLKEITIQHLLEHKAGFDREARPLGDPMFQPMLVRKELKLEDPPTPTDMVRFMMGRKLDFDPGTKTAYSNFGYCVLGRVIEKATGETYGARVRRFLAPHAIKTITLGRTLPDDRDPAEPFYHDPGFTLNCITGSGNVPWPDGGFNLEAMDGHGGLIASAPDLARFLKFYWISGQPRKGDGENWLFNGSLPGTWSMAKQRADGVNIVALFNQRSGPEGKKPEAINDILDKVADGIKNWP